MKVNYRVNSKLSFEIEAEGQKELFKSVANVQEIFGEESCGACKSESLRFCVRNVDSNDYYELRCLDCGAILPFGQHKKGGTLFPKRKDENNNWLPDRGWYKWNADKKKQQSKA